MRKVFAFYVCLLRVNKNNLAALLIRSFVYLENAINLNENTLKIFIVHKTRHELFHNGTLNRKQYYNKTL